MTEITVEDIVRVLQTLPEGMVIKRSGAVYDDTTSDILLAAAKSFDLETIRLCIVNHSKIKKYLGVREMNGATEDIGRRGYCSFELQGEFRSFLERYVSNGELIVSMLISKTPCHLIKSNIGWISKRRTQKKVKVSNLADPESIPKVPSLPKETLSSIFSLLEKKDLRTVSHVCGLWQDIALSELKRRRLRLGRLFQLHPGEILNLPTDWSDYVSTIPDRNFRYPGVERTREKLLKMKKHVVVIKILSIGQSVSLASKQKIACTISFDPAPIIESDRRFSGRSDIKDELLDWLLSHKHCIPATIHILRQTGYLEFGYKGNTFYEKFKYFFIKNSQRIDALEQSNHYLDMLTPNG